MAAIVRQRMMARIDGDFCVFLIGMRVNQWLKIHHWWPVAMAMPRMIKELYANPQTGFLGGESGGLGNPTMMLQYWRSFEALDASGGGQLGCELGGHAARSRGGWSAGAAASAAEPIECVS